MTLSKIESRYKTLPEVFYHWGHMSQLLKNEIGHSLMNTGKKLTGLQPFQKSSISCVPTGTISVMRF